MDKEHLLSLLRQKLRKEHSTSLPLERLAKEIVSEYLFYLMQRGNIPFQHLDKMESFLMEEFYHVYHKEAKKFLK